MKSERAHIQQIISAGIILIYIGVALFVPFLHTHAADAHFHDNCPACQWELQAKNDDAVTSSILLEIDLPLSPSRDSIEEHSVPFAHQLFASSISTRGPPAHS
ncbi:hypothetical protein JXO52_08800 [bacterium]|nr:hypothetical protein [bacterium]